MAKTVVRRRKPWLPCTTVADFLKTIPLCYTANDEHKVKRRFFFFPLCLRHCLH